MGGMQALHPFTNRRGAARGGAAPAWARAPSGRSRPWRDSPAVLAARWGLRTRCAPCRRSAQTTQASQIRKRAARAHLAAALLGAHEAPEPRPASPLVPRFVRAGGAMRESVTPLELTGHRSFHDPPRAPRPTRQSFPDTIRVISDKRRAPAPAHAPPRCIHRAPSSARRAKSPAPRAKHPARRLQSSARHPNCSARHPNSSACRPKSSVGRQKTIAGQAVPRSSHPTHARTKPSHATSEAEKGAGAVRAGAWVVPRSADSVRLPLGAAKGMARTV